MKQEVVMISKIDGVIVAVMIENRMVYKDKEGKEFIREMGNKTYISRRDQNWPRLKGDRPWYVYEAYNLRNRGVKQMKANNISIEGGKQDSVSRLIAAAPDMLESLKEVPAWFEEWNVEIGAAEEALLDRIKTAIEKAEGTEEKL